LPPFFPVQEKEIYMAGFNKFSALVGQFNETLPSLATGDVSTLQLDNKGRLIIADVGITGDINIGNFPTEIGITGDVNVGNFPTEIGITGDVNVGNFPTEIGITGDVNVTGTVGITGDVNVGNFPTEIGITGDVNVGNFPTEIGITGDVNIGNFPTEIGITGDVNVGNFPTEIGITGDVNVGNFPTSIYVALNTGASGAMLNLDAAGALRVSGTFTANVDDAFESGTLGDVGADATGDGVVPLDVDPDEYVTVASIDAPYGTSVYITGFDFSTDTQAQYELAVFAGLTGETWIRTGVINAGSEVSKTFLRAIEVVGDTGDSVVLRAKVTEATGITGSAGGGINAYTRTV
jgi:hypothetical protein